MTRASPSRAAKPLSHPGDVLAGLRHEASGLTEGFPRVSLGRAYQMPDRCRRIHDLPVPYRRDVEPLAGVPDHFDPRRPVRAIEA
jgi:hypothetical protein